MSKPTTPEKRPIYWFVYRESYRGGRVVGKLERSMRPAFYRWRRIKSRLRQGVVRLMYGDCVKPARTYRRHPRFTDGD